MKFTSASSPWRGSIVVQCQPVRRRLRRIGLVPVDAPARAPAWSHAPSTARPSSPPVVAPPATQPPVASSPPVPPAQPPVASSPPARPSSPPPAPPAQLPVASPSPARPSSTQLPVAPTPPATPPVVALAPSTGPTPRRLPPMRAGQSLRSSGIEAWRGRQRHDVAVGRAPDATKNVAIRGPVRALDGSHRFTASVEWREVGRVHVQLRGPVEVFIHDLRVVPRFRGMGIGAALVRTALRFGAAAGCRRAVLEADDHGSGRLVRWYRRLGFTAAGVGPRDRPLLSADIARAHAIPGGQRPRYEAVKRWAAAAAVRNSS